MYAIIKTGGKQFQVTEGTWLNINRINTEKDKIFETDQVILVKNGQEVKVGKPLVEGAKVTMRVMRHFRDKKIVVFKMKRRKNYRKKQGHRQDLTQVMVTKIAI